MQKASGLARCLAGFVLLMISSSSVFADGARQINVVIFAGGLSWPVFVAQDKGFFAKHGLAVTVTETPGSVFQIRGLVDGTFDIAMTPFDNVVAYREGQGEVTLDPVPDIFAFMGGITGTLRLIASPDIGSFVDLRGKTLGVDTETTGYALAMYALLAMNDLPPGSYAMAKTGGTSFRVKALEEGRIAGTMISSPQEIGLEARGFKRLGDVQRMLGSYQALSGVARRAWAEQHAAALRDYIRAYVEASDWLADPANKDEAASVYERHIAQATKDAALKAWPVMMGGDEGFQRRAKFDAAGATNVLAIRSRYGRPQKPLQDWQHYADERFYRDAMGSR